MWHGGASANLSCSHLPSTRPNGISCTAPCSASSATPGNTAECSEVWKATIQGIDVAWLKESELSDKKLLTLTRRQYPSRITAPHGKWAKVSEAAAALCRILRVDKGPGDTPHAKSRRRYWNWDLSRLLFGAEFCEVFRALVDHCEQTKDPWL